jgi:hypothetical protein
MALCSYGHILARTLRRLHFLTPAPPIPPLLETCLGHVALQEQRLPR